MSRSEVCALRQHVVCGGKPLQMLRSSAPLILAIVILFWLIGNFAQFMEVRTNFEPGGEADAQYVLTVMLSAGAERG